MRKCTPFTPFLTHPYWFPHICFFPPHPSSPLLSPQSNNPAQSPLYSDIQWKSSFFLYSHMQSWSVFGGGGLTAHVVLRASTREASCATPLFFCPSGFKGYFGCFTGKICPAVLTRLSNHRPTVVSHSVAAEMRLCLGRWGGSSRKALVTGIFTSFSFLL